MALLLSPLSLRSSSLSPSCRLRARLGCSSPPRAVTSSMLSTVVRAESSGVESTRAALVWFKHDLRVDDHPGLVAASSFRTVVPLYVFDRRILSRFSDEMLELLLFALEDLRKSLKNQGSDLLVRFGTAENVMQELVKEVVSH